MSRWRNKITAFQLFAIVFVIYFGVHVINGYFYCVRSEYANCPGYQDEEDESEDFDD